MKLKRKVSKIITISLFISIIGLICLKNINQDIIDTESINSEIEKPGLSADLPTLINGTSELNIFSTLYIWDAVNFTFSYTNVSGDPLTGLSNASYSWKQFNDLNEIVDSGDGFLIETMNHLYVLDFDTETRDIGIYYLNVFFNKENYESKNATILLDIESRVIDYLLSDNFQDYETTVNQGSNVSIEINLMDPTRFIPILNASVILTINAINYAFVDLGNGTYSYLLSTTNLNWGSNIGIINITKENYTSVEFTITIIIKLDKTDIKIPGYNLLLLLCILPISGILVSKKLKIYF
ncbi:MAG: hypothetical protein ACFFCI_14260 [Promethearchaeota archaeon]